MTSTIARTGSSREAELANELLRVLLLEVDHPRMEDVERLALGGDGLAGERGNPVDGGAEEIADVQVEVGVDAFGGERGEEVAQALRR